MKITRAKHSINANILQLALPMIISNITVPLLGMVDTAVVGHLNNPIYLGGVAFGSMLVMLLFWLAGFLRMSTTGLAAQAYGQQASAELQHVLLRSLFLALCLAMLLLIFHQPLWSLAVWISDGSEQVLAQASRYFNLRIWSAPASLVNLVLWGWLIGCQKSRVVMWLVILNNSINILLDLVLVVGFEQGVAGVAAATLIAEYLTCFVALLYLYWSRQIKPMPLHSGWFSWVKLKRLLVINLDILLRSLLLQLCLATMTFKATGYGDQFIAANAVLMNFLLFASYGLDGIAYAAESLTGSAMGAGRMLRLRMAIRLSFGWSLLFAALFSASFLLGGELIVRLLTSIPEVQQTAETYLGYLIVLPLSAFAAFVFDGVFVGLTWSRKMLSTMAVAALAVFLPLVYLLEPLANHGLWLALLAMFISRGVGQGILLMRWLRGHER